MKHFAILIACLTLTACEPYEPKTDGDTDATPRDPKPPSEKPSESDVDNNGCVANEPTCRCEVHQFRFSTPLPAPLQFPNPLGAMNLDGEYVNEKLACTGPNAPTGTLIDLSGLEPFFVDPSIGVRGGSAAIPADSDTAAQFVQDEFGCYPISNDAGTTAWKALVSLFVSKAINECAKKLEEAGCAPGEEPSNGNGTIGVGAEDVCDAFLGYHLQYYLEQYTEQLVYNGTSPGLIDLAAGTTCAEKPVNESCDFGGSTG